MFLKLAHTKKEIFTISKSLTIACYAVTKQFPTEEKFAMTSQIRRAALSVHLNIAEGCSRKSETERKRYFEITRGSVIEVDTALDIAQALNYVSSAQLQLVGNLIIEAFKQLRGLIK